MSAAKSFGGYNGYGGPLKKPISALIAKTILYLHKLKLKFGSLFRRKQQLLAKCRLLVFLAMTSKLKLLELPYKSRSADKKLGELQKATRWQIPVLATAVVMATKITRVIKNHKRYDSYKKLCAWQNPQVL